MQVYCQVLSSSKCHPEALSIHADKGLLKVYKNQKQIGTVFSTLLDDYPQRVNVVNAGRSRAEACLLTIYGGTKIVFYPIQYDLVDDFEDCGQDTYSSRIIANL